MPMAAVPNIQMFMAVVRRVLMGRGLRIPIRRERQPIARPDTPAIQAIRPTTRRLQYLTIRKVAMVAPRPLVRWQAQPSVRP